MSLLEPEPLQSRADPDYTLGSRKTFVPETKMAPQQRIDETFDETYSAIRSGTFDPQFQNYVDPDRHVMVPVEHDPFVRMTAVEHDPFVISDATPYPIQPGQQFAENDESEHHQIETPFASHTERHGPKGLTDAPFFPKYVPRSQRTPEVVPDRLTPTQKSRMLPTHPELGPSLQEKPVTPGPSRPAPPAPAAQPRPEPLRPEVKARFAEMVAAGYTNEKIADILQMNPVQVMSLRYQMGRQ